MTKRVFAITGCGRSGTLYMTKLMAVLGLDVGHESNGTHGLCSWYLALEQRKRIMLSTYPECEVVPIHIVRNPLKVMTSMRKCEGLRHRAGLDVYRKSFPGRQHLDRPRTQVQFIAQWWVDWNNMAEKTWNFEHYFRAEELSSYESMKQLCAITGRRFNNMIHGQARRIPTSTHTISKNDICRLEDDNPHSLERITMQHIADADFKLAQQVHDLGIAYGYAMPTPICTLNN